MPHQVPKSITAFSSGASALLAAEPLCMAHIAGIALQWTDVETQLVSLVNNTLGTIRLESETGVQSTGNWAARVAMENAETIRTRIKLINAMIAPLIQGTALAEGWKELERELGKASRMQNKIVHSKWGCAPELPGELIRMVPLQFERWSLKDFEAQVLMLQRLTGKVMALTHAIGLARGRGEVAGPPQGQLPPVSD